MNLPNTLSILRIVLSPVFVFLFLSDSALFVQLSFFVFTVAALTDWYDGWYARKYGFKTRWGQFIDPLADKILTSCAFLSFYILNENQPGYFGYNEFVPIGFLVAVIISRDIILTAIRSYKELKGIDFRTSLISKVKTFIQMSYIFLIIALIFVKTAFPDHEFSINKFLHSDLNYYFLFLITAVTILSGIAYFFEIQQKNDSVIADV